MNSKTLKRYFVYKLFLTFILFSINSASAQENSDSPLVRLPPPIQERFVEAEGIVMPWLASGCGLSQWEYNVPDCRFMLPQPACEVEKKYGGEILRKLQNCYYVSPEESNIRKITELYSNDGSLWFRFSNENIGFQNFDATNEKPEFKPFSYNKSGMFLVGAPILRLVSESPNWYEVEINEETRETKFVWKKDSNWTKVSWDYWLGKTFVFPLVDQLLRDKPNGENIKESGNYKFSFCNYFNKTYGDWVFVKCERKEEGNLKEYTGWIRWRDGRYILFARPTSRY